MDFQVMNTKQAKPMKLVIYGVEGIGKTTFASQFPEPVFIDTEGSTGFIDAKKLPDPTSWTMLMEEVEFLKRNPQGKTVVIDTMDWAESIAKQHLMDKNGWKAIDSSNYGSRYVALADEIGRLLNKLSELIDCGLNVVITAHAEPKKTELPDEMGQFDRYTLKLERRDAALVKEWADTVLFANYKTTIITDDKTNSKKATGGQRIMYTTHKPAWDAKNRMGLADELPFDFESIREKFEEATGMNNEQQVQVEKQEESETEKADELPFKDPVDDPFIDNAIPQNVASMMQASALTTQDIKDIIYKGGFMPQNTPLENVPADLWGHIISNWDKALQLIGKK